MIINQIPNEIALKERKRYLQLIVKTLNNEEIDVKVKALEAMKNWIIYE